MYDTIIIGAGMSGLAAGIRLAYFDQRVCILERHDTIGGLNSFYRLRGRDYDVGLHAVTNFTPKGAKTRPAGSHLCGSCGFTGRTSPLAPQIGLGHHVSRRANCGSATTSSCSKSEIARSFPGRRTTSSGSCGRLVDYDDLDAASTAPSRRGKSLPRRSTTRCWSKCCSAR